MEVDFMLQEYIVAILVLSCASDINWNHLMYKPVRKIDDDV